MNDKKTDFTETQKFSNKLLWVILLAGLSVSIFLPLRNYYYFSYAAFKDFIPLLIALAVVLFFSAAKLETRIGEEGMRYRFFPLQRTFRVICKQDIKSIAVVHYSPLLDYGGWGIRFGRKGERLGL